MTDIPLGKTSSYPDRYAPELLAGIPRDEARALSAIGRDLPFVGVDLWNAWELSWLSPGGRPNVAVAEIEVPATTPNIVESKSMKLYLNSFAMTEYRDVEELTDTITADLSHTAGDEVRVTVTEGASPRFAVAAMPGRCIDSLSVTCDGKDVDPEVLSSSADDSVEEALHSHLLRSLCPVTGQPDFGSVLVANRGPRIDDMGLLRYLVSFRRHQDFHEACVERMFMDIMNRCNCESLSVYARYTRRGGIDINPFRSTDQESAENLRLWRQ